MILFTFFMVKLNYVDFYAKFEDTTPVMRLGCHFCVLECFSFNRICWFPHMIKGYYLIQAATLTFGGYVVLDDNYLISTFLRAKRLPSCLHVLPGQGFSLGWWKWSGSVISFTSAHGIHKLLKIIFVVLQKGKLFFRSSLQIFSETFILLVSDFA